MGIYTDYNKLRVQYRTKIDKELERLEFNLRDFRENPPRGTTQLLLDTVFKNLEDNFNREKIDYETMYATKLKKADDLRKLGSPGDNNRADQIDVAAHDRYMVMLRSYQGSLSKLLKDIREASPNTKSKLV